jgi:SF-assemblin/beta giardin
VAELHSKIAKVEQALTAEVRRRVDATHQLEKKVTQRVEEMEGRLIKRLEDQSSLLVCRMKELEDRLDTLEMAVEADAKAHRTNVQKQGTDLKLQLHDLFRELELEKKSRLVREGRFLQQIESHAKELEDRWRQEQEERITEVGKLSTLLETQEQQRLHQQRLWQNQVSAEMAALQQEMAAEVQERQAEDEAIIVALRNYTKQLQNSLAILNGD